MPEACRGCFGKLYIKARQDYDTYGIQTSIYSYVIFTYACCETQPICLKYLLVFWLTSDHIFATHSVWADIFNVLRAKLYMPVNRISGLNVKAMN
jgi:hypothetical protein